VFRMKLIFDLRGLMAEEYVDNGVWAQNSLPFRLVKSVERTLLKSSDRVIVLTEKLKNVLTYSYEPRIEDSRISVIPCCVKLQTLDKRKRARGESSKGITLVYAGSVAGRYMLGAMIDFFRVLSSRFDKAHFLIITRADKLEVDKAFSSRAVDKDHYSIVRADPNEVVTLLHSCDIGISFIKPSAALVGASPTKIGEYLAAGLPIVGTAGGDMEAILQGENVGVIIDKFDNVAYENAVDQILTLMSRDDSSERSREVARRHYSLDQIGGPRYVAVYRSLNGSPVPTPDEVNVAYER